MASLTSPQTADPVDDAQKIRVACEGFGANENGLIELIGHRNAKQLRFIKESYWQQYEEDLLKRLDRELHGDFGKAVYRWMLDPNDREAVIANEALRNNDLKVIVELACTLTSEEVLALRRAYIHRYNITMEEDIASHTTGDVRRLLLLLVSAFRRPSNETDARLAENEAETLHSLIKEEQYNHDEVLRIIGTRSTAQLVATFFRYKDAYGDTITKDLSETHDEYVVLLGVATECISSPPDYLEGVLRSAITKRGLDKDVVTRVVVTRAEKDLKLISELYYKRNSVGLDHSLDKEILVHSHYKGFLLTLLGAEKHH